MQLMQLSVPLLRRPCPACARGQGKLWWQLGASLRAYLLHSSCSPRHSRIRRRCACLSYCRPGQQLLCANARHAEGASDSADQDTGHPAGPQGPGPAQPGCRAPGSGAGSNACTVVVPACASCRSVYILAVVLATFR